MTAPIDVTGQRFGHLVAVERAGKDRCGSWMWLCRCDCGAEVVIGISRLRAANTIGCRLCAARRSRSNRYAQMIEDLEWIIGTDHPESIARRLGYASADTLITSLRRAGRDDLADRLMRANQRGDTIHRFGAEVRIMTRVIEAGDMSARHLGRRVMLPHRLETEGRLVGVHLLLIVAVLILAWTPATGALAAVCCALILWTVLCHLAATPKEAADD